MKKNKEIWKINTGMVAGLLVGEISNKNIGWSAIRFRAIQMDEYHSYTFPFFTLDEWIKCFEEVKKSPEYKKWLKFKEKQEIDTIKS